MQIYQHSSLIRLAYKTVLYHTGLVWYMKIIYFHLDNNNNVDTLAPERYHTT